MRCAIRDCHGIVFSFTRIFFCSMFVTPTRFYLDFGNVASCSTPFGHASSEITARCIFKNVPRVFYNTFNTLSSRTYSATTLFGSNLREVSGGMLLLGVLRRSCRIPAFTVH